MPKKAYKFEDYLEQSNQAETQEELFNIYSNTVAQHGLNRVMLCLATDHKDIGEINNQSFMHNYPKDWMGYYFEKNLAEIDPIIIFGMSQIGSYTWDDVPKKMKLAKKQKNCLDMGREAGLYNGICTPLRGPNNALAGLSLASSEKKDSFDGNVDLITAYSNHFYLAYRRLGMKKVSKSVPNYYLTDKEREVLTWTCRGKSYNDIADITNTSRTTVVYHMRNIFKKLDVNDSILAVVKALTYGLIHPY